MDLTDTKAWASQLEGEVGAHGVSCVDRVVVVDEAASTQDEGRRRSGGRPGLLVIAARQTAGRGRLGRAWADTSSLGLAATFALDAGERDASSLSIAAGLAACAAAAEAIDDSSGGPAHEPASGRSDERSGRSPPGSAAGGVVRGAVGLRWPNDVVERAAPGRKVAGVLIEADGPIALVGVGINVAQAAGDWPPELRGRAVSLRELGSGWDRRRVSAALLRHLDAAVRTPADALADAWRARDVLVGTRCTFECHGQRYTGIVETIDPTSAVVLRQEDGRGVRLPALITSLIGQGPSA